MADKADLDASAYEKLGSASEKFTEIMPFATDLFNNLQSGANPLGAAGKLASAMDYLDKASKAIEYGKLIKEAFDEYERKGGFALKAAIKIGTEVGSKLLGRSLETHPYYVLQKPGLELLGNVLTSAAKYDDIVKNYDKAINMSAAMKSSAYFGSLQEDFRTIANRYVLTWDIIGGLQNTFQSQEDRAINMRVLHQLGQTKFIDVIRDLRKWRMAWAGLAFRAFSLSALMESEARIVKACIVKADKLIKEMRSGNVANRVAGGAAQTQVQWAQLQADKRSGGAMNPINSATNSAEKAHRYAMAIAEMCDFARTAEVFHVDQFEELRDRIKAVLV